jgi:hypothetical protein
MDLNKTISLAGMHKSSPTSYKFLLRNLVISTKAKKTGIRIGTDGEDITGVWITNANNEFVDNHVVGTYYDETDHKNVSIFTSVNVL